MHDAIYRKYLLQLNSSSQKVGERLGGGEREGNGESLLKEYRVSGCESRSVVSDSSRPHRQYSPWNSPGQNTGVGILSLLQGIFPTHGSNPGLPHCRQILYQLSHQGSRKVLEWVACPFSSGSSQPKNRTRVSCIAGRFFTN